MKYIFSWITFLLSTAGVQIFQQSFIFQRLILRFFKTFAYNRFQIYQQLFLLSTAGSKIVQQLFCLQPPVFRFFSNFFAFNHWFSDISATFLLSTAGWKIFSATFLLSTVFRFFSNFFGFNHWFSYISATLLLSTSSFHFFSNFSRKFFQPPGLNLIFLASNLWF